MISYLFYFFIKSFSIFGAQWNLSTAFRSSWILMVHLLKFNKIFPRLAAALAGWKASKPMLQELSPSSSSVPWWRRQRLCLKRRFTYLSNYLMWLLVWESFTEFSYHESFRLHAYQNGCQSVYQSRLQLKNHWTNLPEIWYWEILEETVKLSQFWFKSDQHSIHFTQRPLCISACIPAYTRKP